MTWVDLLGHGELRVRWSHVQANVTVVYVVGSSTQEQEASPDGCRARVEVPVVLENKSRDMVGIADLAQQKRNDHGCLEDDEQPTRVDEEARQKQGDRVGEALDRSKLAKPEPGPAVHRES